MERRQWFGALAAAAAGLASWAVLAPQPNRPTSSAGRLERVVSLSPALTEMLFAIGAGERVVGVTDFCTYPDQATRLPRCGGLLTPNLERLTELRPDLVLMQDMSRQALELCTAQGVACQAYSLETLADVPATMRDLARRLGLGEQAERAVRRLELEMERVRRAAEGGPARRVFVCVGREQGRLAGLATCAQGTFLDDLVTLAGGTNVFGDATGRYPMPSLEELTRRAPEVILELRGEPTDPAGLRADWATLTGLPAVREGRVEVITGDWVLLPGPRLVQTARALLRAIRPEAALMEENGR